MGDGWTHRMRPLDTSTSDDGRPTRQAAANRNGMQVCAAICLQVPHPCRPRTENPRASRWELLSDFVAHDVGDNLTAAGVVALLTAGRRQARKRGQQQEDKEANEQQQDNETSPTAPD
jgi:hypothetical protein